MNDIPITLTPGNLAPNPCYSSEQARLNAYIAATQASLPPGYTTIITSQTAPGPDQRTYIWCQVDANNRIIGFFTFANGQWQTINPTTPYLIPGEFRTFDPGQYTPVAPWYLCDGSVTGVPDLRGCFLVGQGQRVLPSGSTDTATNFVAGTTGGRQNVILDATEIPAHSHLLQGVNFAASSVASSSYLTVTRINASTAQPGWISGGNSTGLDSTGNPNPPDPVSFVPPYYVVAIMQWRPDLA